jgi:tRNA-specific 2-thiouridylase
MSAEKSVLVGMSGGIDSTAVCSMLLSHGYRVVGLTFVTCEAGEAAAASAVELAARLGIEHHVVDVRDDFRRLVVEPFIADYLNGLTPNPCVNCNPTVKFRILEEWADRLGCDRIATGHYVKVECHDRKYYIVAGDDDRKDQSYFLWRLTQRQLSRVLFPLGGWEKRDVLEYLASNGMQSVAHSGESMEVCFIPGDYRDFLRGNVPGIEEKLGGGQFVDSEGRPLGKHKGYPFYTVGQRKGLGISLGHPLYVIKTNPAKNTVMLGCEEQLVARYMLVDEPQWVGGVPAGLSVRVRYRSRPIGCDAPVAVGDGRWLVALHEDASAIAPGQSAVFYCGNTVVGGAFIADQRGINQWIPKND